MSGQHVSEIGYEDVRFFETLSGQRSYQDPLDHSVAWNFLGPMEGKR